MSVEMKDANTIIVDGNSWSLVDAVMNNRDRAAEIHDAYAAWVDRHDGDLTAAVQSRADAVLRTAEDARQDAEDARRSAEEKLQKLSESLTGLQEQVRQREAAAAFHLRRADLATQQVNLLLTADCPAALAVYRELRTVELQGRQAQIDAETAALAQEPKRRDHLIPGAHANGVYPNHSLGLPLSPAAKVATVKIVAKKAASQSVVPRKSVRLMKYPAN